MYINEYKTLWEIPVFFKKVFNNQLEVNNYKPKPTKTQLKTVKLLNYKEINKLTPGSRHDISTNISVNFLNLLFITFIYVCKKQIVHNC